MLRDKNLIPLSHQHQHALALCVRIQRAMPIAEADLEDWQAEIRQMFEQEIATHFAAEESELFPAASQFDSLRSLVQELLDEHAVLREYFWRAQSQNLDQTSLRTFADRLSAHVRKEERQLFEEMQTRMPPSDMAALGRALGKALKDAPQSCLMPREKTRLRPRSGK